MNANIRYFAKSTWDELLILGTLAKVTYDNATYFNDEEYAVLAALRRTTPDLSNASPEEIGDYLRTMNEDSIVGVVNNTKGVLHEMEFVALENEDGDTVYASLFADPHHADTDVQFTDSVTGSVWEAQLKTTSDPSYINEWLDQHPDGDIIVNSEMADKMGLASSGLSNQQLTLTTEDFLDKALAADDDSLWDYVPFLSVASISWIVWGLWQRYCQKLITLDEFKQLAARATGIKVAKISVLVLLLSIPVVNVVTGAALVAHVITSLSQVVQSRR
ncbi:MAG: hypothetical protein KAY00_04930 [Agitococcus sp.]|nr:hypothetical protein [Agitococcus sp.]